MSDGPYTEDWPKRRIAARQHLGTVSDDFAVVPLSDAERLREALERIGRTQGVTAEQSLIADSALKPERDE